MTGVWRWARGAFAVALLALCASGCGEKAPGKPAAWEREYREGAAALRMAGDRAEMSVAETLKLALDLEYPEGWQPDLSALPEAGQPLAGDDAPPEKRFTVAARELGLAELLPPAAKNDQTAPAPGAGSVAAASAPAPRLRQRVSLTLTPFLAGDYAVPALGITFRDGEGRGAILQTEPQAVKVAPVLTEAEATAAQPRDIVGLRALPPGRGPWGIAAAAGLLVLLALWGWRRRLRRPRPAPPPLPPEDAALAALDALLARGLPAQGRYEEFYVEVSAILRTYVEKRFALAAPEQTTEEFLHGVAARGDFSQEHRRALGEFLRHCDLVKFARLQPSAAEAAAAAATCRDFIVGAAPKARAAAE